MKVTLEQVSKRFQKHWIFKDISTSFLHGEKYALLGANGSGKSTLLRILAGMQSASRGKVFYFDEHEKVIPHGEIFSRLSFCAPGQEIVEELTLNEFLTFHFSFKKLLPGLSIPHIIELTGLKEASDKPIADYSSGMKQRVKLAQAIFTDSPLLLLDEPCTNLDLKGVDQYTAWMEQYAKDRTVIVASNDIREYFFCKETLAVEDYK